MYVWGASPQVLRLQAQAQKKTRILEQRDANKKRNKVLDESEKMPSDVSNLNEETKEECLMMDAAQTESAQTDAITSDVDTQKRLENADLRDLNFDLIEESQAHLKPCVVDTSLVKAQINQVCNIRSLKFIYVALIICSNITYNIPLYTNIFIFN